MTKRNLKLLRAYHLELFRTSTRRPHPLLGLMPRTEYADSREEALEKGRALLASIKKQIEPLALLLAMLGDDFNFDDLDVFVVGVAFGVDAADLTPEEEKEFRELALVELEKEKPHITASAHQDTRYELMVRNGPGDYTAQEQDRDGEVLKVEQRDKLTFAGREQS